MVLYCCLLFLFLRSKEYVIIGYFDDLDDVGRRDLFCERRAWGAEKTGLFIISSSLNALRDSFRLHIFIIKLPYREDLEGGHQK